MAFKVILVLNPAACHSYFDAAAAVVAAALRIVVFLVCVQLLRSLAWQNRAPTSAAHTGIGFQQRLEESAVVGVSRGRQHVQGQAVAVGKQAVLRTRFPSVGRVLPFRKMGRRVVAGLAVIAPTVRLPDRR